MIGMLTIGPKQISRPSEKSLAMSNTLAKSKRKAPTDDDSETGRPQKKTVTMTHVASQSKVAARPEHWATAQTKKPIPSEDDDDGAIDCDTNEDVAECSEAELGEVLLVMLSPWSDKYHRTVNEGVVLTDIRILLAHPTYSIHEWQALPCLQMLGKMV